MKMWKQCKRMALVSAAMVGTMTAGCAALAPSGLERLVTRVETNYVQRVVLETNQVTVVVTVTNAVGVPVYQTNYATVTTFATNVVPVYTMTPNATAEAAAGAAGMAANLAVPGIGTLVTTSLLGLLSIWLGYRNRKFKGENDALSQSAGVLAQIIETGREILAKTPQGQQSANAFTAWMVAHQAETETIAAISKLVKGSVDNAQAQEAAEQILKLIGKS